MSPLQDDPFTDPSADITIWSSDGVAFKLHKVILMFASEYFKNILTPSRYSAFAGPSSGAGQERAEMHGHDGSISLHLPETSGVLDAVFRLLYPVDDPSLETIGEVRCALEAAMTYQLREAVKITKRKLLAFAASEPMRVYAIACHLRLEDTAKDAAKEVLKQQAQYTFVEELEDIPASTYQRLLYFCKSGRTSSNSFIAQRASLPVQRTATPDPPLSRAKSMFVRPSRPPSVLYTPKVASRPFNARDADVVLSTPDGMQFRVYKNIIELASPILASKLSTHNPVNRRYSIPLPEPVQRLAVPESSQTLAVLLKTCYPTDERLPNDPHTLYLALLAAQGYQMEKAVRVLQDALMARKDDKSVAPEVLYAIACRCHLRELANAAARRTLHTSCTDAMFATFERYALSAAYVQRLLAYRERCREAARYVVGPQWRTQLESSCRLGKWASDGQVPCWYERYMSGIAEDAWPTPATATNPELLRAAVQSCENTALGKSCRYCSDPAHLLVFYEFTRYVAETIEAGEDRVVLDWHCESDCGNV